MAHVNVTPEEVLGKILNEVSDDKNDDSEDIASLTSNDNKNCEDCINIT